MRVAINGMYQRGINYQNSEEDKKQNICQR